MLRVNIDLSQLAGFAKLGETLEAAARSAAGGLATQMYAKAVELAGERLHSRREMYVQALQRPYEDDGVWVLALDAKAAWIEDGLRPHSMLDQLLSGPNVQPAKDGSRYVVVPFNHSPGQGPATTSPTQMDLINTVKAEMKAAKIPWGKIERDDQGRPKIGLLHKFNIDHAPLKTAPGPGQGWGPVGEVRQGPNARQVAGGGPGGGGRPFLHGVRVYQQEKEGKVSRSVMTFRVASSKHYGTDRWRHPGLAAADILKSTEEWALQTLEREVLPALIARLGGAL